MLDTGDAFGEDLVGVSAGDNSFGEANSAIGKDIKVLVSAPLNLLGRFFVCRIFSLDSPDETSTSVFAETAEVADVLVKTVSLLFFFFFLELAAEGGLTCTCGVLGLSCLWPPTRSACELPLESPGPSSISPRSSLSFS
jgi:hypothetical protein